MRNLVYLSLIVIIAFTSCSDDDPQPTAEFASATVKFNFNVNGEELVWEDKEYIFNGEDTVEIEIFKFIMSNFKLNSGSSSWKQDSSYFLIEPGTEGESQSIIIPNVPVNTYSGFEFYIGLDSATNFKPEGNPVLFQDAGMYWEWNTGYRFMFFEAKMKSDTVLPNTRAIAHIGNQDNLKLLPYFFTEAQELKAGDQIQITFDVNIAKLYEGDNKILLSDRSNRNVLGGSVSELIAENYGTDMITLRSIIIEG